MKKILVIGGGAGGLELVTRLGNKLGAKGKAEIMLVDKNEIHIWKPLLHEVAAGSLDSEIDQLSYQAHARNHHFTFKRGELQSVDPKARTITLAAVIDDSGDEVLPQRTFSYDYLVLAIGSVSNDFGTPGIAQHGIFLDSLSEAKKFHRRLLNAFIKLNQQASSDNTSRINIAIIGAGATGVELSAELYNSLELLHVYGLKNLKASQLNIQLIEAGPRILPALPDRISNNVSAELTKLGIQIHTDMRITGADEKGIENSQGERIDAQLIVWAAGVKAPDFLQKIDGFELSPRNQIIVKRTLQSSTYDDVFAIGDCAACELDDGTWVPPRAQSAHQMASHVYDNIRALLNDKPLKEYQYKDHGSLISLSRFSTVGSLMGNLTKGSLFIEGRIARSVYISLYRMHQVALHGWIKTTLMTIVGKINRVLRPRLKLH